MVIPLPIRAGLGDNAPMSRQRLPRHLKLVKGTIDPRKDNPREPQPVGNLKDPPGWMTMDQTLLWAKALANAPAGMLKKLDESIFTAWVIAADIHRRASHELSLAKVLTTTGKDGVARPSVYISMINKQATIMKSLGAELGFSPVSRSRVVMTEDEDDEKIEDEYFR